MANLLLHEFSRTDAFESFISKLHFSISNGLPHAQPHFNLRTDEHELVKGVLQVLQGLSTSLFYWDEDKEAFHAKPGIFVTHLSQASLNGILNRFLFAGTCLKHIELLVKKAGSSCVESPTLNAFLNSVSSWLKRLRDVALEEEVKSTGSDAPAHITLLRLTNSLSSLLAGAERLLQFVYVAIPNAYFLRSLPAGEIAVHILDCLFKMLNEVWLVESDEEDASHMLLSILTESILPYLEGLDSWLYDGILDDPFQEMFFYANNKVAIDQPSFWETSYLFRQKRGRTPGIANVPLLHTENESTKQVKRGRNEQEPIFSSTSAKGGRIQDDMNCLVCPVFLKDMAKAIVSAGKSLQLARQAQDEYDVSSDNCRGNSIYEFKSSKVLESGYRSRSSKHTVILGEDALNSTMIKDENFNPDSCKYQQLLQPEQQNQAQGLGFLTLSESFLVSLFGLLGDGDHVYEYSRLSSPEIIRLCQACKSMTKTSNSAVYDKSWLRFLADVETEKGCLDIDHDSCSKCTWSHSGSSPYTERIRRDKMLHNVEQIGRESVSPTGHAVSSFCPSNPVLTMCSRILQDDIILWNELNISKDFHLPPVNDDKLREAIFVDKSLSSTMYTDPLNQGTLHRSSAGTDYAFGFQFDEAEHLSSKDDMKALQFLFACPTLLPCFEEKTPVSELLPFQRNSTLASRILMWVQKQKFINKVQPAVFIQECLTIYVKKQVDHIGKHILLKLMSDWKLMDELGVLRAIYLLGSGDLLQHFLTVMYNKLDKGESWDDDFELNTILQESIRNSADGTLIKAPDSLVVSFTKGNSSDNEETDPVGVSTPRRMRTQYLGIDALDSLKFTYKVSWPLDLIANVEAINKYNQVMGFLLKVKHAKFVLDKTRKWMWKGKGGVIYNQKHHLLVAQKLLHFVDAFHQYVMDRVLHGAWTELCSGMASAGSLDEVIEVHEAYLMCIQRQCFVAPDKLWALIASRIKTILGLALDFYSIEQTLYSGGAASAIKARCEMEVDQIEKQFGDCIAFLLRILSFKLNVGHFPHLADLVTRINYNHYYMSESGNLLTLPNFETAAVAGKT